MWTWAETRLNKDGREKFAAACPLNFCRLDIRWHRGSFSPRLTSRRFDSSRRASTAARLHLPECKAAAALIVRGQMPPTRVKSSKQWRRKSSDASCGPPQMQKKRAQNGARRPKSISQRRRAGNGLLRTGVGGRRVHLTLEQTRLGI